mmetsp:Transcript_34963/g.51960  ORF Transcript_34963/g.51960 Transcript_34963/m.51960 type:complete len:252 (+) Transcript_34963:452-1207(+)
MMIVSLRNWFVQLRGSPRSATINRNIDTFYLAATTRPSDALDRYFFFNPAAYALHTNRGTLWWVANKGCYRLFMNDGTLVQPCGRPFGQIFFKGNVWCKVSIRFALIRLFGFLIAQNNLVYPLDLSSSDMTWNDHPDGISMISWQVFAIHFIRQQHFPKTVHSLFNRKGSTVRISCFVMIISFHLNMFNSVGWHLFTQGDSINIQTTIGQDITKSNATPFGSRHGTNDPMRRNEYFVILIMQIFSTISSTL